jgi:hypothetical protein
MLIGHFGVGLAARRLAPRAPMALLLAAPLFLDLLWPVFFFLGLERFEVRQDVRGFLSLDLQHVPYTHGLVTSLAWSAAFAAAYWLWRKDARGALVLAALVFSHWALDFIAHTPDLPLVPGSEALVGLGLWRSTLGTIVVEGTLFAGCVFLYARDTVAKDRSGALALWLLVAVLLGLYADNLFGAPAKSASALAAFALTAWAVPLWGLWLDKKRDARPWLSTTERS